MATKTRAEKQAEDRHKAGFATLRFTWTPEGGVEHQAEYVLGLTLPEDSLVVFQATDREIETFLPTDDGRIRGNLSVGVLWWIARRRTNEPRLKLPQVLAELGELGVDNLDIEEVAAEDVAADPS